MKTKRILINLAKRIEADNLAFEQMSNDEKKVVIAEDCLIRIKAQQLNAHCGLIVSTEPFQHFDGSESLQTILNDKKEEISCNVCAKGGLFLSLIGRENKMNVRHGVYGGGNFIGDSTHKRLLEIFTARELAYIEFVFEGHQYLNYDEEKKDIIFTDKEIVKARKFYVKHGGGYSGDIKYIIKDTDKDIDWDRAFDHVQSKSEEGSETKRLIAICKNIIKNKGIFTL